MMDQNRFNEMYRIEHRHKDGSWAEMAEVRSHHDAAEHDPERSWGIRRLFRCKTCEEELTISPGGEGAGPTDIR
jgi:hypothetical protein